MVSEAPSRLCVPVRALVCARVRSCALVCARARACVCVRARARARAVLAKPLRGVWHMVYDAGPLWGGPAS